MHEGRIGAEYGQRSIAAAVNIAQYLPPVRGPDIGQDTKLSHFRSVTLDLDCCRRFDGDQLSL